MIDSRPGWGIWVRWNDSHWTQLNLGSPQDMVTADLDGNGKDEIVVDFGALLIWSNNANWINLHGLASEELVSGNTDGD